jgi:hypothetical protein
MRIAVGDAKICAEEKVDDEKGKAVWWEVVQQ